MRKKISSLIMLLISVVFIFPNIGYADFSDEKLNEYSKYVVIVNRYFEAEIHTGKYDKNNKEIIKKELFYSGYGTGFLISEGYVLTNEHVSKQYDDNGKKYIYEIEFYGHPEESVSAVVVDSDKNNDIALLKYDSKYTPKEINNFFKISEQQSIGEEVYVIGHPMNVHKDISDNSPSILYWNKTKGTLDKTDTTVRRQSSNGWKANSDMIVDRYNINIYGGNSGSPVINSEGNVIGMISSSSDQYANYGYAVRPKDIISFLNKNNLDKCIINQ